MKPDGYIYCEVRKVLYGLKKAVCLAFDNLVKLLEPQVYFHVQEYPGLCKHYTWPKVFTLYVDNFGIKTNLTEDAHHIINAIIKYFKWSIDWEGQNYLSLTLDWNYTKK